MVKTGRAHIDCPDAVSTFMGTTGNGNVVVDDGGVCASTTYKQSSNRNREHTQSDSSGVCVCWLAVLVHIECKMLDLIVKLRKCHSPQRISVYSNGSIENVKISVHEPRRRPIDGIY